MTNNPRNRNRVVQTPHATPAGKRAPIPTYHGDDRNLQDVLKALAHNVDMLRGNPAVPFDGAATKRQIAELGLMGTDPVKKDMPHDGLGVSVWTSRQKFEMVSAAGLAAALAEHLSSGDGTVSLEDFNALKDQVESIGTAGAVTQSSLTAQLGQLQVALKQKWMEDIKTALAGVSDAQINRLQQDLANVIMLVRRLANGFVADFTVAEDIWVVEHNLESYPSVITLNASDEVIWGDVVYDSLNQVTITHGAAITGKAIFR